MKKLILGLLAMASVSAAQAQAHTLLVYGSASYDKSTINGSGYSNESLGSSWSVMPGIGYQLNQHVTIGVQGGYSKAPYSGYYYSGGVSSYSSIVNATDWNVGVFGRYTQWLGSIFFVYGQVNMSYAAVSNDAPEGVSLQATNAENLVTDGNGFKSMVYPGIGINICKGFAVNMSIGGLTYTSMSQTDGSYTVNRFNINFGQEVNIGVSKNFGGRSHHHHHHMHEPGMELRHIDVSDDDDDDLPPPPPVHKKKEHKDQE